MDFFKNDLKHEKGYWGERKTIYSCGILLHQIVSSGAMLRKL
jgi:hypothetical protein